MTDERWVVLDANVIRWVSKRIDPTLTVVELIVDAIGSKGITAYEQLHAQYGFERIRGSLADLPALDERAAAFLMQYRGAVNLQKVHGDDPADIRFLVFAIETPGATLVTNERALLQIAGELNAARACLKAAVHRIDEQIGGMFDDASFNTRAMFDPSGTESFFHYQASKRCSQCDPKRTCKTQVAPPRIKA